MNGSVDDLIDTSTNLSMITQVASNFPVDVKGREGHPESNSAGYSRLTLSWSRHNLISIVSMIGLSWI